MVSAASPNTSPAPIKRRRKAKPGAEIVLICNPRAGGRWKELAGILDSEEAHYARRIVTDSVEDIATGLAELSRDAKLVCIYGGDGTVQRALDRLAPDAAELQLALLGGGTMNVTSRWCGFSRNPARNFRYVVRAFRSGQLLWREVPVLEVDTGKNVHRGFTFGMGPIVRLLDTYERGEKGKAAALGVAARAIAAAWLHRPADYQQLLEKMTAEVELDGERLPHDQFAALFANVTGQINPGVEPFTTERTRESFHCAAYAVGAREMTVALPLLARGWLPLDIDFGPWLERAGAMPRITTDARYVNQAVSLLHVRSPERLYTVDGEILYAPDDELTVRLGPHLKLAVGPAAGWKMAAAAVRPGA
jgi:diacylglycerol kinase family enzyme